MVECAILFFIFAFYFFKATFILSHPDQNVNRLMLILRKIIGSYLLFLLNKKIIQKSQKNY